MQLPTGVEWSGLIPLLQRARAEALAFHNLATSGLVQDVPNQIAALLRGAHARSCARYHILGRMLTPHLASLARAVPFMVLKGTAWAHTVYPCAYLRQSEDVDLLLRADDVANAYEHLRRAGWAMHGAPGQPGHGPKALRAVPGYGRLCLELHDDLVPYRDAWAAPSIDVVLSSSMEVAIWGVTYRTCALAVALLHAATKLVMDLPAGHHRYAIDFAYLARALGSQMSEATDLADSVGARGMVRFAASLAGVQTALEPPGLAWAMGSRTLSALHAGSLAQDWVRPQKLLWAKAGSMLLLDSPRHRVRRVLSYLARCRRCGAGRMEGSTK